LQCIPIENDEHDLDQALRLGLKFFTYIPNTVDVINYSFFLIPLYFKVHFYLLTAPYIRSTGVAGNEHQIQNSTNSSFSSPQELHDSPTAKKNGSNLTNGSNFTNVSIVVGNQRQMPYYGDGLEDDFLDLDYAGWVFNMIALLNGFNSLFTWLKLFSYLQFLSKHAQHFIRTISIAAVNLGMMVALCTLILWAYAQTVFVSFGTDIPEYKSLYSALVNTFKALIEGFDIDNLRATNEYLGFILYASFLFVAFFIMMNLFIAIIAKAYDETSGSNEDDPMAHEFVEVIYTSFVLS
jgi:hypothetical protein